MGNSVCLRISFASAIYVDFMGIFLIFIKVTRQKFWTPKRNHSELLGFEKARFNLTAIAPYHASEILRSYDCLAHAY